MIVNNVNGKKYIGSTKKFKKRKRDHWYKLNKDKHTNPFLQSAWNKYGEDAFCFTVLEVVDNSNDLIPAEQRFFDLFKPEYNLLKIAGSNLGYKPSDKTRKKTAEIVRRLWLDTEYRTMMVDSHTGYKHKPESIKKIRGAVNGEKNPSSVLTESDVKEIKKLLSEGNLYQGEIAKMYGVKRKCINAINTGTNWTSVEVV